MDGVLLAGGRRARLRAFPGTWTGGQFLPARHAVACQVAGLGVAGGNFAVVTSFLFRLHPVKTIIGGPPLWTLDQAAEAIRFYDDFMRHAPNDLNGFFAFLTVPPAPPFPEALHLQKMCSVVWCYTGPARYL
ncbi:MAG: hypothetical protein M5U01_37550 [Ardenticatenaceae bacterium]|nr:hypothetical protein [Ardenticatenaceae bacterium]